MKNIIRAIGNHKRVNLIAKKLSKAKVLNVVKVLRSLQTVRGGSVSFDEFGKAISIIGQISPTFLMFMRFLSYRSDVVGGKCSDIFRRYFEGGVNYDFLPNMDEDEVRKNIENEYSKSFDEIFISFDFNPVKRLEFIQIHKAKISENGRESDVLVAVQAQETEVNYKEDLAFLQWLAGREKEGLRANFQYALGCFQELMETEVDLRFKAAEISELESLLSEENSWVKVPEIDWLRSSKNMMTYRSIAKVASGEKLQENIPLVLFDVATKGDVLLMGMSSNCVMQDGEDVYLDLSGVMFHKINEIAAKYIGKMLLSFIEGDFDEFAKMHRLLGKNKQSFEFEMNKFRALFLSEKMHISTFLIKFMDYIEQANFPNIYYPENDLYALQNCIASYEKLLNGQCYDISGRLTDFGDFYMIRWAATGGISLRMNLLKKPDTNAVLDAEDVSYFQGLYKPLNGGGSGVRRGRKAMALLAWGFIMYLVFSSFR